MPNMHDGGLRNQQKTLTISEACTSQPCVPDCRRGYHGATYPRLPVITDMWWFSKTSFQSGPWLSHQQTRRLQLWLNCQWKRQYYSCGSPRLPYLTEVLCNLLSNLMLHVDICECFGIQKLITTAYHLQSNGFVERFNRTLKQSFRNKLIEHSEISSYQVSCWHIGTLHMKPQESNPLSFCLV